MHGPHGTDCTQTSPCACIRPECLNYCLGVRGALLPGSKVSLGAACSASQEERGHIDSLPRQRSLNAGIAVWMQ